MPVPHEFRYVPMTDDPKDFTEVRDNQRQLRNWQEILPVGQTLIERQVLTADAFLVTFNSIPQVYNYLEYRIQAQNDSGATQELGFRFNEDDASTYAVDLLYTAAGGVPTTHSTILTYGRFAVCPTESEEVYCVSEGVIHNYTDDKTALHKYTTFQSSLFIPGVGKQYETGAIVWSQGILAPITRIDFGSASGNITAGSIFSLYGVY